MVEIPFARLDELTSTWEDIEAALLAAQNAQQAAETAQQNAETAEQNAEAAQQNAETAEQGAVAAQGLAEAAQLAAENARDAAIQAKTDAETAETNAETAQGLAEDARDDAIDARDAAYLWAQEDEDTPVNDGTHSGFSAFHWAEKAAAAASGTGAAQSVLGNPTGSVDTRVDIELAQDTVLGRDGSGNVDDIKIKAAHIDSSAKSGADTTVVTGTAGTSGNLGAWNSDGDLVDSNIAASNVLVSSAIGSTVQPFDADTAKTDVAQEWTTPQNADAGTLTDNSAANLTTKQFWKGNVNGGDFDVPNPSAVRPDTVYCFRFEYTTSHTVNFGSAFHGNIDDPTATMGAVDYFWFMSNGDGSVLEYMGCSLDAAA